MDIVEGRLPKPGSRVLLLSMSLLFGVIGGLYWGVTVWTDFVETLNLHRSVTRHAARLLEEHAHRTFRSADLVLQGVIAAFGGVDLEALRHSPEAWDTLKSMAARLPETGVLWVYDAEANAVLSSTQFPAPPANVADRGYFQAHRHGGEDFHIGGMIRGKTSGKTFFTISRRLTGPNGEFAGVVQAGIETAYFTHFYDIVGLDHGPNLGMYRTDGTVLVRKPLDDGDVGKVVAGRELFGARLLEAAVGTYEGEGLADAQPRIVSYRKLEDLPVVVVASVPKAAALAEWRARLYRNAVFAAVALVVVVGLTRGALGAVRREDESRAAVERQSAKLAQALRDKDALLKQKDILFKELNHRIKNNLQLIESIFRLQSRGITDPATRDVFEQACQRVSAIAHVHTHLYLSDKVGLIKFDDYLSKLCENLSETFLDGARDVVFDIAAEPVQFDIERAIPLGLVVSELICNALKHAFDGTRQGHIRVELVRTADNRCRLTVADDGRGLKPDGDSTREGLGLQLVAALVAQIKGQYRLESCNGLICTIDFPGGDVPGGD